jgi:hypothetical protein
MLLAAHLSRVNRRIDVEMRALRDGDLPNEEMERFQPKLEWRMKKRSITWD